MVVCLVLSVSMLFSLVLPALTNANAYVCGEAEHTHSDGCYLALICGVPEGHVHSEANGCYGASALSCVLEEGEYHQHSEAEGCYAESALICAIEENHEHIDNCYAESSEPLCGLKEHAHTS